jgi:hypothetical protein
LGTRVSKSLFNSFFASAQSGRRPSWKVQLLVSLWFKNLRHLQTRVVVGGLIRPGFDSSLCILFRIYVYMYHLFMVDW